MWLFIIRIVVYSFFGWGVEGLHNWLVYDSFYKPNFLYGPVKPMYGIAAAALLHIKQAQNGGKMKFLLAAAVVPLTIEYFTGLGLFLGYGLQYWDYSKLQYQYQGIVCLQYTFFWMILAYFVVQFLHPFLAHIYQTHKEHIALGVACAVVLFSMDIILTFWNRAGGA